MQQFYEIIEHPQWLIVALRGEGHSLESDSLLKRLVKKEKREGCQLFFSLSRTEEVLQELAKSGRLYFRGKKLIVDPFTPARLSFVAKRNGPHYLIEGNWQIASMKGALKDCEGIIAGDPAWLVAFQTARRIPHDYPCTWLFSLVRSALTFSEKEMQGFLDKWGEDLHFIDEKREVFSLEVLPFLKLKDRTGAFADLWMSYGEGHTISFEDSSSPFWRKREEEKRWEKDLLETDYRRKVVSSSQYYCPMDRVGKSLGFLLDIGWTIYDCQEKKIVRYSREDLELVPIDNRFLIKGKIHYGAYTADLKEVIGAFQKRERFIDLSPQFAGFLGDEEVEKKWTPFLEEEVTAEGVCVKKAHFGFLEEIFPKKEIEKALAHTSWQESVERRFSGTLYPYQEEGVEWLLFLRKNGFHGLLADEMGLGKTVQVLAFLDRLFSFFPTLIIAPTSLLFNWRREIERFLPGKKIYIHEGKERVSCVEELQKKELIITSFATVRIDRELLEKVDFEQIIVDEATAIKNFETQIAKALHTFRCRFRLAITGTPIENRWEDLWSLFAFLMPELLGDLKDFRAKIAASSSDSRYLHAIKKRIRPFLLRRQKELVAHMLPQKDEQTIWIEMGEEERDFYEQWLKNSLSGLVQKVRADGAKRHRLEILEILLRLRQICCHPLLVGQEKVASTKFETLIEDLKAVVLSGKKALIYSQFTEMLALIAKEVQAKGWNFCYLDGATKNREEVIDRFQKDANVSLFLLSLKAGGVG